MNKIHEGSKGLYLTTIFLASCVLGYLIVANDSIAIIIITLMVLLSFLIHEPVSAFYIAYPLLFILPLGALSTHPAYFPNTPFGIVITVAFLLGLASLAARKQPVIRSNLYFPILICAGVLASYALLGHGERASAFLFLFIAGLWPFALVVLLVKTPRQVRNILMVLAITVVVLSALWLPGVISSNKTIIRQAGQQAGQNNPTDPGISNTASMLFLFGSLKYPTLLAIVFTIPLFLGLIIVLKKRRFILTIGLLCLLGLLLLSTYGMVMLGVILIISLSSILFTIVGVIPKKSIIFLIILLAVLSVFFFFFLPQGKDTFSRLSNPYEDASASYRIWVLKQEIGDSWNSVLIGHGSYAGETMTSTGEIILGHNSFTSLFFENGLIFIVPFLYLLLAAAHGFIRLIKRTKRPIEKALAAGMAASLLSTFVLGFFDPIFMGHFQDSIIWLFIGFMTLWNNWLDDNPEAILIA